MVFVNRRSCRDGASSIPPPPHPHCSPSPSGVGVWAGVHQIWDLPKRRDRATLREALCCVSILNVPQICWSAWDLAACCR